VPRILPRCISRAQLGRLRRADPPCAKVDRLRACRRQLGSAARTAVFVAPGVARWLVVWIRTPSVGSVTVTTGVGIRRRVGPAISSGRSMG
jgi:ferric-dicitrate binding protein FerR (iron transport regulator)